MKRRHSKVHKRNLTKTQAKKESKDQQDNCRKAGVYKDDKNDGKYMVKTGGMRKNCKKKKRKTRKKRK